MRASAKILSGLMALAMLSAPCTLSAQKKEDKVIATVGNEKITFGELDKAFQKNINRKNVSLANVSKDSVMDFINLYVKYRLKVNDAFKRGFDKDPSVKEEIEQNRRILAESFFYDKKLVEPNVETLFKRREKEVKIAIILTTFNQMSDTTDAYNRIKEALDGLSSGFSFEKMAEKFSDDKDTKYSGGVLPNYITGGKVYRAIEDAIYSLKPGEFTKNYIRTQFGYFLIKLIEEQPRSYVRISHILLKQSETMDSVQVYKLADSISKAAKTSAVFAKLAEKYSVDKVSANNGGYLGGYYSRSSGLYPSGENLESGFENAVFALKDGEVSSPISTSLGIHIIRRDSTLPVIKTTEKEDLKLLYKRLYFNDDKRALLDIYALQYGLKIDKKVLNEFLSVLDTNKTALDTAWASKVEEPLKQKQFYSVLDFSQTVGEFINTIKTRPEMKSTHTNYEGFKNVIDKLTDPMVFAEASKNLENEYTDFSSLVKEFRDGILLYKAEADEVWNKLKFDSVLAKKFFDTTSMDLTREPMYEISEIYLLSDTAANNLYGRLKKGELDFAQAAEQYTQRSGYRTKKGSWGLVAPKYNKLALYAKEKNAKVNDILPPHENERGYSIIKIDKFESPRKKTFEEAIPDIAPKVQDMLQKQLTENWIDSIKKDFPVSIDDKALNEIIKKSKK